MSTNLPDAWSDSDVLTGLQLTDKSKFENVPFRILGVSFRWVERDGSDPYQIVDVDIENAKGEKFTFNDSSSGVCAQVRQILTETGNESVIQDGTYHPMKLVIPLGLRVSEYRREGAREMSKTYYLTTNGERGESLVKPADGPLKTTRRASKP